MKRFLFITMLIIPLAVSTAALAHGEEHSHFDFSRLIIPAGITTFIFMFLTLTLGLLIKKNRKIFFPWHRRLAFLTIAMAVIHVSLILLLH